MVNTVEVDENIIHEDIVIAAHQQVIKALKLAGTAFGTSRAYWCKHCGTHVIEGHTPACPVVISLKQILGNSFIEKNIQIYKPVKL